MPVEAKSEYDFLKELLIEIINERERKYEARFDAIDKSLGAATNGIKEAIGMANTNTRDALNAANASIETMARGIEARVNASMAASKEAILKAEIATEKRFESMNEFRGQMADMQTTLVRKSEVDIKFEALEKTLNTAVAQLQMRTGQEKGIGIVWGIVVVAVGFLIGLLGIFLKWKG